MRRATTRRVQLADRHLGQGFDERGDTLLEVLITVLVVSITSIALLLGFSTSISGSAAHRALASNDVAMRTVSQSVYAQVEAQSGANVYDPCAAYYGSSTPSSEFNTPTGYLALVTVTSYWYQDQWNTTAPSSCPSSPPTVAIPQQLLISLQTPNSRTLTTTIVVTQPLALVTLFTISSLTPSAAAPNTMGLSITITGTGFETGALGSFPSTSGITFSGTGNSTSPTSPSASWTVVSPTSIVAQVDVAATAPIGAVTFTVTNPDGSTATSTFTVSTGPTITSVSSSPSIVMPGSDVTYTIIGAGFVMSPPASASTVAFSDATVFPSPSWTVNSSSQITATVSIPSGAPPGSYTVTVTNPGTQLQSAPYPVTVAYPPPVITAVTGSGGATPCPISPSSTSTCSVTGNNFYQTVSAYVSQTSGNYNTCTPVATVSNVTLTALTLTFTPSSFQPAGCTISGDYDLTIFAAGGQSNLFSPAFSSP